MPTVRRIIVGVHGSLGSLQALRYAADEARQRNVPLLAVTAWVPPGGDMAERRHSSPYLRKIWREAAWERLWAAFDAGLGGVPADLTVEPQVARGETGPVLVDAADQPDDLLIIGTGRRAGIGPGAASFGQPLLPGARAVPGAGRAAFGADGRDEPRPALLAAPAARAHSRHPRAVAAPPQSPLAQPHLTPRGCLVPGRGRAMMRRPHGFR